MASTTTHQERFTGWVGASLAALTAGALAALSNLVNFVGPREAYFVAWGVAHLLVFGFGLWAARVLRAPREPGTYATLAFVAAAVEAVIVFGVLNGLIIVDGGDAVGLAAGFEDFLILAATITLFTAGAMHGARGLPPLTSDTGPLRTVPGPSPAPGSLLVVAGPLIALIGEVIKLTG